LKKGGRKSRKGDLQERNHEGLKDNERGTGDLSSSNRKSRGKILTKGQKPAREREKGA